MGNVRRLIALDRGDGAAPAPARLQRGRTDARGRADVGVPADGIDGIDSGDRIHGDDRRDGRHRGSPDDVPRIGHRQHLERPGGVHRDRRHPNEQGAHGPRLHRLRAAARRDGAHVDGRRHRRHHGRRRRSELHGDTADVTEPVAHDHRAERERDHDAHLVGRRVQITIGLASADQISGAFTCTDLSGGSNAVVDVTGSFNAQG